MAQGGAKPFHRLGGNFYGLKAEKVPTGMVALGGWLACCRVGNRMGILPNMGQGTGRFRSGGSWLQLIAMGLGQFQRFFKKLINLF